MKAEPRIRTLIVDDEPLARERIRSLLAGAADLEVVGECASGRAAVRRLTEAKVELLFLDVQMPVMNGFEVLHALPRAAWPVVIFVTAYDHYALRAFEVNALDYLLKPFDAERFQETLDRARRHLRRERMDDLHQRLEVLLAALPVAATPPKYTQRFAIRTEGRITFLAADEVEWIQAANNYVQLHCGKVSHLLRETLTELEQQLDPAKFVRIHRSSMVSIAAIKELQPLFRGDYQVALRNGVTLPVGRSYRERLLAALDVRL